MIVIKDIIYQEMKERKRVEIITTNQFAHVDWISARDERTIESETLTPVKFYESYRDVELPSGVSRKMIMNVAVPKKLQKIFKIPLDDLREKSEKIIELRCHNHDLDLSLDRYKKASFFKRLKYLFVKRL